MEKETKVREILGQLCGFASMCWEPKPIGIFQSTQLSKEVAEAEATINEIIEDAKMEWYNKGLESGRNEAGREAVKVEKEEIEGVIYPELWLIDTLVVAFGKEDTEYRLDRLIKNIADHVNEGRGK